MRAHQPLNAATGAIHAAAACDRSRDVLAAYEDVGRHNALDKLVGGLAIRSSEPPAFILVTSRISFEMVDKALVAGVAMLVGISAPTRSRDRSRARARPDAARARPERRDPGRQRPVRCVRKW
ncbi:formate dehydrogenase accessory sulfurtransferase FdhD [Sphingomonas aerolata]|uniref:formate dehydrogenase accessory sulfurtransferase FdhD n=1 Tax=Sphingomonas aerolata TaxID=185951 RepID=UPI002FDF9302